jgi:hypothetical protein
VSNELSGAFSLFQKAFDVDFYSSLLRQTRSVNSVAQKLTFKKWLMVDPWEAQQPGKYCPAYMPQEKNQRLTCVCRIRAHRPRYVTVEVQFILERLNQSKSY